MTEEKQMAFLDRLIKGGVNIGQLIMDNHGTMEISNNTSSSEKSKKQEVSPELSTEDAQRYWQRLEEAGFVDAQWRLASKTTRKQAMYIAEAFAVKIGLKSKWKPFEVQWDVKNLAQEKWDMQQTGVMPLRYQEIDLIFEN